MATLNEAACLVDAIGDWIKVDLHKRYTGADPTAAQGTDDQGLITASRGVGNTSAGSSMTPMGFHREP